MKLKDIPRIALLHCAAFLAGTSLVAQTWITAGAAGSLYTQPDNTSLLNNDWVRAIGVGYFTPNGIVPESYLHVNTQFSLLPQNGSIATVGETFRTTVGGGVAQRWRMERDNNEIGRFWHQGTHRSLHIMAPEQRDDAQDRYSGVLIQNNTEDGLWVMNDGPPTGGRAFPNAVQLLDAVGFAALGRLNDATAPGAGMPRGPWSRLHFFHANAGGSTPWFAHRSQMRNGVTFTGNSDHAYMGQWYDQGTNGTGAEVDDRTNLVIATSEDELPSGNAHHWDHISFRFMGDMAASQGSASSVDGMEMLRIRPYHDASTSTFEGFVGVGDFLAAATGPEERLDVLDRTVRIRDLPTDYEDVSKVMDKVVVVDSDGRLHWRPMTDLTARSDVLELYAMVQELCRQIEELEAALASRSQGTPQTKAGS